MSQTNDIHPQLGAPPSPMTEEGRTGEPARDDAIDDRVDTAGGSDTPVYDSLASEHAAEDGSVDFGSTADDDDDDTTDDEEPDELGGFVVTEEDDPASEQIVTEEYSVADGTSEDPMPADLPAVLQDDGTGVEDADVETSLDEAPAAAAAGTSTTDTDYSIGHVFDQTNGVIEAVDGESDGTADGEARSSADREGLNQPNPVGQQDAFADDHYGTGAGRDVNP